MVKSIFSSLTHLPLGLHIYMLAMLLFNALIWSAPLLLEANSPWAPPIYDGLHFTCHQLDSRSLCLFPAHGPFAIGDCLPQNGTLLYQRNMQVVSEQGIGFKVPVCARDIGIYGGMLVGGLLWLLMRRDPNAWPHVFWLIFFLLPMGIDGTTQLFGLRESTNTLRLITGTLAGLAMAFYAIPACCMIFGPSPPKRSKK